MGTLIDLTGQIFGDVIVIERDKSIKSKEAYWKCQCSCGKIFSTRGSSLRQGKTLSCGCKRNSLAKRSLSDDLTGQTFGELTVLSLDIDNNSKGAYWICKCSCGNIKSISGSALRQGRTKSCGCRKSFYTSEKNSDLLQVGQHYGKWTIVEKDITNLGNGARYICKCECGTIKSVSASNLKNGSSLSCGCLLSTGEQIIADILASMNFTFAKEYSFNDLKGDISQLRFDFAIFKDNKLQCLLEYQGEQHYKNKDYFDRKMSFDKRQEYDRRKREYCKNHNIKLIEIPYWDKEKLNEEYLLKLIGE